MNDLDALLREREALIARMDLTRTRYRAEMLINRRLVAAGYRGGDDLRFAHDVQREHFPRSLTFRLLTRYPLAAAAALAALWLAGPRASVRSLLTGALVAAPGMLAQLKPGGLAGGVLPFLLEWLSARQRPGAG